MASNVITKLNAVSQSINVAVGTDYAAVFIKSVPGEKIRLRGFSWGVIATVAADAANIVSQRMYLFKSAAYPPDGAFTLANILAAGYEQIYSEVVGEDGGQSTDFSKELNLEPGFNYLAVVGDLVTSAAITNPTLFICVRGRIKVEPITLRGQEPVNADTEMENLLNANC